MFLKMAKYDGLPVYKASYDLLLEPFLVTKEVSRNSRIRSQFVQVFLRPRYRRRISCPDIKTLVLDEAHEAKSMV